MAAAEYVILAVEVLWLILVNVLFYCLNENSWPARKVRFRGFLTVSNRAKGTDKNKAPEEFFAWDLLDPSGLVSGHCVGVVPILVYRVFVLLVFISNIIYQGVLGAGLDEQWLKYFTYWTFVMMGRYALLGIIMCSKATNSKYEAKWGLIEKAFTFVFLSACCCGIFITIFYWTMLFNGHFVGVYDLIYHGGNVVLMLGELLLSRIPICSYHLQIALHYLGVYAAFFWIYFAATGIWVYSALSFESDLSLATYAALPVLMTLSFYFMHLVALLRERAFGKDGSERPSLEELL